MPKALNQQTRDWILHNATKRQKRDGKYRKSPISWIAKKCNVSRSSVSKVIASAIDNGDLRLELSEEVKKRTGDVPASESPLTKKIKAFINSGSQGALKIPNPFREAIVIEGTLLTHPETQPEVYDVQVRNFGILAAPYLLQFFASNTVKKVGVGFGRMLLASALGVSNWPSLEKRVRNDVGFYPLWGSWQTDRRIVADSTVFQNTADYDSSRIAMIYSREINGPNSTTLSLAAWPSVFPKKLLADREFRRFLPKLAGLSAYSKIFGDLNDRRSRGVIHELDMILAGVGTGRHRGVFWSKEAAEQADIDHERLCRGSVGDICGHLLARKEQPGDARYVEQLQSKWLGLKKEHLADIAKKEMGVCALAIGVPRAEVLLRGISDGIVTRIIIDSHCADEMHRLIDARLRNLSENGRSGKTA